jgi:hypothetical protein
MINWQGSERKYSPPNQAFILNERMEETHKNLCVCSRCLHSRFELNTSPYSVLESYPYEKSVFFLVLWGGVRLSPLGLRPLTCLLYQPQMIDECGAGGGMRTDRGNRNIHRIPVPLYPPQIPHDLTWDWTRAAAVGSRQLTAWTVARLHANSLSHKGELAVAFWCPMVRRSNSLSHFCFVLLHPIRER